MAASGAKNVGSYGKIRVLVDLVLPQNIGANTSQVRVRGQMALRQGSNAHNNNGVHMKTTASPGGSTTESNPFSVGTSWVTVIDNTYTVSHASDGNRTVTGTFELGSTGTTSFGSGGSVSLSLKLPRIPRPPSKPGRPTVSNVSSSAVTVNWSAPASNGAGIDKYQIRFYRETGTAWQDHEVTSRSRRYTGLDPNSVYRARVRAHNAAGWGPWSEYWTGSTKIAAPAAPTNVQASRSSDNRHVLTWSRNATSAKPYASQRILREDFGPNGWSNVRVVATVSGSATSYTDTTTGPNSAYGWWVEAVNASGSTRSSKTVTLRTTPAPPHNVQAFKVGDDIRVSYDQIWPGSEGVIHEFQDNPNGEGWVNVGTVSGDGAFMHFDVDPAKTHQYRIRTSSPLQGASGTRLVSAWSTPSNVVQLLAPPLAPTPLTPMGTMDRDEPFVFSWQHNPVDTTDQTEFELEWWISYQPSNPVTVTGGSEQEVSQSPLGSTNSFSWRVRTKGEYAGANPWSPWSPTQTFYLASRPEVVVQSPESTIDQSQVEVVWGYQNADASAQSRWEAQLLDAEDNVLATGSEANTATAYLFPTILDDATTYTVRVRARAGSGLWSEWDTTTFTTDFPLPVEAMVDAEWDRETGAVALTFDYNAPGIYVWTGTPNNSMSEKKDGSQVVARNWWPNPKPQTSGLFPSSWTAGSRNHAANPSNRAARYAGGSLEGAMIGPVPVDTTTTQIWRLGFFLEVYKDANVDPEIVIKVGSTTVVDTRILLSQVAPGTYVEHDFEITSSMSGDLTVEFTSTGAGGGPVNQTVWIGSLRLAPVVEYADEYFDGDTPDTGTIPDSIDVQRDDGHGWITIATGLDPETSIVDAIPKLGEIQYRAISRTTLPTARTGPETITGPPRGLWPVFLNGGPDMGDVIAIYDNTQLAFDRERAKTRHVWAGRDWPTTKWGQARSKTVALTATISPESPGATMPEIEALEDIPSVVCVRDILGHKIFVTIDSVSADVERDGRWNVSIPMTREHYIEGVR